MTDGKELNGTAPQVEKGINITEEMCKTSLWKNFVKDGSVKKPQSRKSKSGDKHKHKHRHHHHQKKHSRHRRGSREGKREEEEEEEEGLWMLEKKEDDDEGSDAEMRRKLATIDEDKNDVVIDMDQIQKSLLELDEIGNDEEDDEAPAKSDTEAVA